MLDFLHSHPLNPPFPPSLPLVSPAAEMELDQRTGDGGWGGGRGPHWVLLKYLWVRVDWLN